MNIDLAIKKLNNFSNFLSNQRPKLLLEPTRNVERKMKERIFLDGLDANEDFIHIGYNSPTWISKRQKKNLQINYYDLKFTGRLEKNTQTIVDGQQVVIAITNPYDYNKKALYQEKQLDKPIFLATDREVELLAGLFEYELDFYLDIILE